MAHAARLGLRRGWIEFRHSWAKIDENGFTVVLAVAVVITLFFQREIVLPGTTVSLAMATLPGVVGLMIAFGGIGAAGYLTIEREDGTLLRCKAVPHGMIGYLAGRVLSQSLASLLGLLIVLVPGLFFVPELLGAGIDGWATLLWMFVLGQLATLPWGAVLGSLIRSPTALAGLVMLPVSGLAAISGIFYPIAALPGWVAGVAQVFPVYWLGLGTRSALLPDSAAAAEIAGSWRAPETVAVLLVWAIAGFLVAPIVLRRMARRESGSAMQRRREQAMQRVGV